MGSAALALAGRSDAKLREPGANRLDTQTCAARRFSRQRLVPDQVRLAGENWPNLIGSRHVFPPGNLETVRTGADHTERRTSDRGQGLNQSRVAQGRLDRLART